MDESCEHGITGWLSAGFGDSHKARTESDQVGVDARKYGNMSSSVGGKTDVFGCYGKSGKGVTSQGRCSVKYEQDKTVEGAKISEALTRYLCFISQWVPSLWVSKNIGSARPHVTFRNWMRTFVKVPQVQERK